MSRWGILFVVVAVLLVPVQAMAQTPSPTPGPTAAPTSSPTSSPSPRPSPTPQATASPTPAPVALLIDDEEPQAGQYVVVRGTACQPGEAVFFGFDRGRLGPDVNADRFGAFQNVLQIPPDAVENLSYTLFAVCGTRTFSVAVTVGPQFRGDMSVEPEAVPPGGSVILRGGGCAPGSTVRFFLDNTEIGPAGEADGNTQFNNQVRIPRGIRARVYAVSARCGDHATVDEIEIQGGQVGQTPEGGVQTGIATSAGVASQTGGAGVALLVVAAGATPFVRRRWARVRGNG